MKPNRAQYVVVADWAMKPALRIAALGFTAIAVLSMVFVTVMAFVDGPLTLLGVPIVLVVPYFALCRMPMEIRKSEDSVFVYSPLVLLHGKAFREFSLKTEEEELVRRIRRRAKGYTSVRKLDAHSWVDNLAVAAAGALLDALTPCGVPQGAKGRD